MAQHQGVFLPPQDASHPAQRIEGNADFQAPPQPRPPAQQPAEAAKKQPEKAFIAIEPPKANAPNPLAGLMFLNKKPEAEPKTGTFVAAAPQEKTLAKEPKEKHSQPSFVPPVTAFQPTKPAPPVEIPADHPWVEDKTLSKERQELRSALRDVYIKYLERCAAKGLQRKPIYTFRQLEDIYAKVTATACVPDYEHWRPWKLAPKLTRESDDPILKCRSYTMSVLNIITSENFEEVSNKLLTYSFHSADDFKEMSFCLHDKALFDLRFQDLYALLVFKLNEHAESWAKKFAIVEYLDEAQGSAGEGYYFRTVSPHDNPNEYNWIGPYDSKEQAQNKCVASFSIRRKIIDKSYEFMKAFPKLVEMGRNLEKLQQRLMTKKSETGESLTPEEEQELEREVEEMDYEYQKLKKSHVANISFMGHLYRHKVIFESMLAAVLSVIYQGYLADPNFEIIEALCSILTLAGKKLQIWVDLVQKRLDEDPNLRLNPNEMQLFEQYPKIYELLKTISEDSSIPFRKRAVVLDLIDLKGNDWVVSGHLGTVVHTTESLSRQEMRARVEAEEKAQRESLLGKGGRGKYSDGRFTQSQDFRRSEKGGLRASKGAGAAKGKEAPREGTPAAQPAAQPAAPSEQYIITDDEKLLASKIKPSLENFAKREGGYGDLYENARILSKSTRAGYVWAFTLLTTYSIKVDHFVKAGQGLAFLVSQKFVTTMDILNALLTFFKGKDSTYAYEMEDLPNIDQCIANALLACITAGYLNFDQLVLVFSSIMYLDAPRYSGLVLLGLTVDRLANAEFVYDVPASEFPVELAPLPTANAKDIFIQKFKDYDEVHKLVVPSIGFRNYKSSLTLLSKLSDVVKDSALVKHMEAVLPLLPGAQGAQGKDKGSKDTAYYSAQLDELMKSGNEVCQSRAFVMTIFTNFLFEVLDSLPKDSALEDALPNLLAPLIPLFDKMFKDVYGSDPTLTRLAVDVADAIQLASICAPPTEDDAAISYVQVILNCFLENKVTFIDTLHLQKWLDLRADGIYQPYGRAAAEAAAKAILGSSPTSASPPA